MQVFYKKIQVKTPESSNPYLATLEKLTHLDLVRLQSVVTDLWWFEWEPPIPPLTTNC
jgi:hypothetical protein